MSDYDAGGGGDPYFNDEEEPVSLGGAVRDASTWQLPADVASARVGDGGAGSPPPPLHPQRWIVTASPPGLDAFYSKWGRPEGHNEHADGPGWVSPERPYAAAGSLLEAAAAAAPPALHQTQHHGEAYRIRRLIVETEALRTLQLVAQEGVQVVVEIRLAAAQLAPEGRERLVQRAFELPPPPPLPSAAPPPPPSDLVASRVYNALRQSASVCKDKAADSTTPATFVSPKAAQVLGRWIAREWRNKKGSVLTELVANLKSPLKDKVVIVAKAGRLLQERVLHEQVGNPDTPMAGLGKAELFVMSLYTMAAPDIDLLMGYTDAPSADEQAAWDAYKPRNEAFFRVVNSALRAAGTATHLRPDEWPFCDIRKWVKTIVLLSAVASVPRSAAAGALDLSRGLAGLPGHIVRDHAGLRRGDNLIWTAPSSCALDPSVSRSYIKGEAANAVKTSGGTLLFELRSSCGLMLQTVSKYPREAEVLLPPLSCLRISGLWDEPVGDEAAAATTTTTAIGATVETRPVAQLEAACADARTEARTVSALLDEAGREPDGGGGGGGCHGNSAHASPTRASEVRNAAALRARAGRERIEERVQEQPRWRR
eukprot:Rhum_TRINITY_DN12971_c0_g1::Rhum_TRINITY_DN12971_c0_g1_i1::g.55714::m.55714